MSITENNGPTNSQIGRRTFLGKMAVISGIAVVPAFLSACGETATPAATSAAAATAAVTTTVAAATTAATTTVATTTTPLRPPRLPRRPLPPLRLQAMVQQLPLLPEELRQGLVGLPQLVMIWLARPVASKPTLTQSHLRLMAKKALFSIRRGRFSSIPTYVPTRVVKFPIKRRSPSLFAHVTAASTTKRAK